MPKYQPLATVAATALLAASYTQRTRNEGADAAHPPSEIVPRGALATKSASILSPYGEDEYSDDAARRIGQAFARLGIGSDEAGIVQTLRTTKKTV